MINDNLFLRGCVALRTKIEGSALRTKVRRYAPKDFFDEALRTKRFISWGVTHQSHFRSVRYAPKSFSKCELRNEVRRYAPKPFSRCALRTKAIFEVCVTHQSYFRGVRYAPKWGDTHQSRQEFDSYSTLSVLVSDPSLSSNQRQSGKLIDTSDKNVQKTHRVHPKTSPVQPETSPVQPENLPSLSDPEISHFIAVFQSFGISWLNQLIIYCEV